MDKIDTPRTEHIAQMCSTDGEHSDVAAYNIMYDLARTLERELSASQERVRELEGALIGMVAVLEPAETDFNDDEQRAMESARKALEKS